MRAAPSRILRLYLSLLGATLLVQGIVSLALRLLVISVPPVVLAFVNADDLHAAIHIIWGVPLLLATGASDRSQALLTIIFGVFYVGLAFLGVLIHHPLGLQLGPGENAFHFIVGPLALVLGVWAWWGLRLRRMASAGV